MSVQATKRYKKIKRRRGNTLENWEIEIVKAMIQHGDTNDQDILAYFTRPTRSVNHRFISEIRHELKHKGIKAASDEELRMFFSTCRLWLLPPISWSSMACWFRARGIIQ